MKPRIKHWAHLSLSIALLAPAVDAAEIELTITPPNADWLVYPELSPEPCSLFAGGPRLEACPKQLMPEGIAEIGEQSMIIEIEPLLAAGDYEAVLARIGLNYGPELVLLEAGDFDAFMGTRTPTDGSRALPPPPDPEQSTDRPTERTATNEAASTRENRPAPTSSTLNDRGRGTRGIGLPPDTISAAILYIIGHSYFSLERYLPAETAFDLALQAAPNHLRAHESLGMLYLRTERYGDARTHLAQAVEFGRNTAQVHAALGLADVKTRRYSAAAHDFQRALVLAPDDRGVQRGLLLALTETREHEKAQALVEQLLRGEPGDRDLWLYRAQIALLADERAVALASLETALRLGDDSVGTRKAVITLQMESGNIARAVDLMQGAAARGLEFSLFDEALGWLANENEWDRFRQLLGAVDRASLGGAEQSRLLTRRATLALRDGNRRAASTALEEALALDPSNTDALMALGQLYHGDRDYGRADLLFRRASAYPAALESSLVARTDVAIAQENYGEALTLLRSIVTGSPARGDLQRNIALLERLALLRTQR